MTVTISGPKTVVVDDPPFLLLPEEVVVIKGPGVMTVLKTTGENPAPKLPAPFVVVVPANLEVPASVMTAAVPACDPEDVAAASPSAVPKTVSTNPVAPPVLVKLPLPFELASPPAALVTPLPVPVAEPPLVAVPVAVPPRKLRRWSLRDPFKFRLNGVFSVCVWDK